ncbi:lmo0937 family membrane protein [Niastella sp. OAS944]|uniref:lmo0937 family membrane protein n=1 Tax=Niastella sp. OAS944 TaxID=2664089 RepID=UPI00347096B5|nr:putative ferric reductase [Chitinophagaceae bacterium OAS944]
MRNLLYIVAVILVVGWLVGFLGYHASGAIHLLLVLAIIAVLVNILQGKKSV